MCRSVQAGVQAAQANVKALEARLRTVQTGATPEEIEVARQRVADAEQALRVAQQQVQEAVVTAPFAGIITAINAELGQPVGAQGVVRWSARRWKSASMSMKAIWPTWRWGKRR